MDGASAVLDLHLGPSLPLEVSATATGAVFTSENNVQATFCLTEEAMLVCLRRT